MRTANPALNDNAFRGLPITSTLENPMTIGGTVHKSMVMLGLLLLTAFYTWQQAQQGNLPAVQTCLWVGSLGGFIVALITIFKKTWSPATAPLYALLEGLALGGISASMERQFPGIVLQAVALTFTTAAALLVAYQSKLISVTQNMRLGIVAATGGIFLVYLVSFIGSFFGLNIPFIHSSGPFGILFSLFVCGVAAMNLVLDFDFIESGAQQGAPKYMEWYGAFGLMITLVWLYIEILRLLSKMRSRR